MVTTLDDHDRTLSDGMHVLVFRSDGSPECQWFDRELDEFSRSRVDVPVWTVDDSDDALMRRHDVTTLPTVVVYRDGFPLRRHDGPTTSESLESVVEQVAESNFAEEVAIWTFNASVGDGIASPAVGGAAEVVGSVTITSTADSD